MAEPVKIFISYAQKDESWLKELENHLNLLTRQKLIIIWGKHKSLPGTETISETKTQLQSASIILLLISPDYLASDDCWSQELDQAIQRHKSGEARVIPILLRSVDWKRAPFAGLQALPRNDLFITSQQDTDAAFSQVAQGVRETVEEWIETHPEKVPSPVSQPSKEVAQPWNIPFQPTPFFTGREEILAQIHTHLTNGQIAAISGLGGVGKTQTAVQYAHRHKSEYSAILWVRANTLEELAEEFANLAKVLDLSSKDEQDQQQIINTVKYWLKNTPNWLLIFDNGDELSLLPPYLPQEPQGHILLTTRAHAMSGLAERVEVPTMDQQDGASLLLHRAGLLKKDVSLEKVKAADLQLAYKIVHELGGLPLALDQAGAYVEETGTDLASYLEIFKDESAELLKRRGGISPDHVPVATTWKLALETIEQTHPEAIELMRLYSFLAPDAIPEELLKESVQHLSPALQKLVQKPSLFNEAIAILRKYALIQRHSTTKTLTVHRLIQMVVKDGIKQTQHREMAALIVRIIDHAFPFDEDGPWPQSQRYLSHALLATEYIKRWSFTFRETRNLSNRLGVYFLSRGQYDESEPFFLYLRAFFERIAGKERLEAMHYFNNLANLYRRQGKYEEAEPLYKRALKVKEEYLGLDHPEVATSLNNLAILYNEQGKYKEAEPLLERVLKIREAKLGLEHPDTAASLNNLAFLYNEQGKYEEAERLHGRALRIREAKLGLEHPDTAISLNNLADLYREQRKYEKIEPLLERALKIREDRLGLDHPDVAITLNTLALFYYDQMKYVESERLYQRALTIVEQRLGAEHSKIAINLNNLANIYRDQGNYVQAEPLYQRALSIFEQRLGNEHPDTATCLYDLAILYDKQNNYKQAEPLYQQALSIREQHLGIDHPRTIEAHDRLRELQEKQETSDA